jgi:hypothetical protein
MSEVTEEAEKYVETIQELLSILGTTSGVNMP